MKIHLVLPAALVLLGLLAHAQAPTAPQARVATLESWPELPPGTGFLLQDLAGGEGHGVKLSLLTLAPGAELEPTRAVKGQLVVYVLEGTLAVRGTREKPLGEADAALLSAGGFGVRNAGKGTVQALVVTAPLGQLTLVGVPPGRRARPSGPAPAVRRAAATPVRPIASGRAEVRMLVEGEGVPAYLGTFRALPGLEIPAHLHPTSAELLFVRAGKGRLRVHDSNAELSAGSVVFIPPGVEHAFAHLGDEPLDAVQIYAPPGPEQRFKSKADSPQAPTQRMTPP
jgi:quercetin dioxygenase-like cupin family protein